MPSDEDGLQFLRQFTGASVAGTLPRRMTGMRKKARLMVSRAERTGAVLRVIDGV